MFDTYYLALDTFSDLMNNTKTNQEAITQAWNLNWQILILPKNNLIFQQLAYVARVIGACCFLYSFYRALQHLKQTFDIEQFMFLIRPMMVLLLLIPNGDHSAQVTFGLHRILERGISSFLAQEVNGVKIKQVIYDPIATASARDALIQELNQCSARPMVAPAIEYGPPQLTQTECVNNLKERAEELQNTYEQQYCGGFCPGAARFFKTFANTITDVLSKGAFKPTNNTSPMGVLSPDSTVVGTVLSALKDVANAAGGYAAQSGMEASLYAKSWMFTNSMEGGQLLSGLIFPIVLAISLMPEKRMLVFDWFVIFGSFTLALLYYDIAIGLTALLLVYAKSQAMNTLQYAYMLGYGAPAIALGLATGGAFVAIKAANQSYAEQIGMVTSVANSVVSIATILI
ncbi:hypothetical protein H6G17_08725 [Chroococcidiopsis sp. FACHB-1243]|uniref:hypothetical protein n=1 Tax=Chroococcidiopsis sp. [FACHB-1243] TaxID=2692781 RepID=UPI00177D4EC4|nr:hypothetical protein [Chroococcidiopsis sp. [FACHB-1243]]MBD2305599.1 hypothetical protein [Chroococcidiopsis sp. [FACHB-1243]]